MRVSAFLIRSRDPALVVSQCNRSSFKRCDAENREGSLLIVFELCDQRKTAIDASPVLSESVQSEVCFQGRTNWLEIVLGCHFSVIDEVEDSEKTMCDQNNFSRVWN